MTPEERESLIRLYRDSYGAVYLAAARLSPTELDHAAEGEWSPRRVVHHLADSELFRSARLRILLVEGSPHIPSFDEAKFAERLHYDRPIDASLALLKAAMDTNLTLLDSLEEADWSRAGEHEEFGHFSVEDWLQRAANHGWEHLPQLQSFSPG